jgi:antitoxin ParD1/3/4
LRDFIRKDKTENEKFLRLKNAIQEGIDSGICDDTIEDIMLSVEKDLKRNEQL